MTLDRGAACALLLVALFAAPPAARADPPPSSAPPPSAPPPSAPPPSGPLTTFGEGTSRSGSRATLTLSGYVEAFYQYNFNQPSNGLSHYRGFDNRHNAFTIANAVVDALGTLGPVSAHLALQVGHTPETYYLAEPDSPGGAGAGATGAAVWKYLQQANVGWRAPLGRGLLVEAGLFLSPVGPEGMAIKDQWSWSRSNLFFGLPYYHAGLRATYPLTDRWTASVMACNGWNSVVDNNDEKALVAQLSYNVPDRVTVNLLYFTGVERPTGAAEGRPWRHLLDAYVAWYPRPFLALLVHGDGGFEPTAFGVSAWAAGALYLRLQPLGWLYLAVRGDFFYERVAESASGRAAAIFWPARWVSSGTATIDVRPTDNVSLRLEYRHDHAADPMYFRGAVATGAGGGFIPNAAAQDTLTAGATAWF